MVKKTRRKQSAGKRVKTAKRRKNNTRSKRGRGGRGGRGGRSAKRGGMPPAARIGAAAGRVAATAARNSPNLFPKSTLHRIITTGPEPDPNKKELVMYGTSYHRSFDDIPRASAFETAAEEFYDEAADPVKTMDKAVTAFANAENGINSEERKKRFSEHTALNRSYTQNVFSTPNTKINIQPPYSSSFSSSRSNIYKTPGDSTIKSGSPPPPDLFVQGTAKSHLQSPSFRRNFAPTLTNPNPDENTGRILDFEESSMNHQ